jgi:hypothetical protein
MKYTLTEWLAEGERRFGANKKDWAFICPACGRISTQREFAALGVTANGVTRTCIGRHNGKGVAGLSLKKGDAPPADGCDWTAGGLLGTLNGGDVVDFGGGNKIAVFSFAEADANEAQGNG